MKHLKIRASILAMGLAALAAFGSAAPAHATTTAPVFKPYKVTQTWYKAGGTADNIWPQTTAPITCGGIKQVDKYTIDTADLDAKYKALISGGVLNSAAEDAPFHPVGTVTVLPACVVEVFTPVLEVAPPTCDADGYLPFTSNPAAQNPNGYEFPGKGYRVYLDRAYAGPGTYTATIQKVGPGFDPAFPGGTKVTGETTQTLTVLPKTAVQHGDANAPCYVAPPEQPADIVTTVTTNTEPTCPSGEYTVTTQTTTTKFTYDAESNTWIKGEPVVTTTTSTETSADECPVVVPPVTEEPTPPTTEPTPPVVTPAPPVVVTPTPAPTKPPVVTVVKPVVKSEATPTPKPIAKAVAAENELAFTGSSHTNAIATAAGWIIGLGLGLFLLGWHMAHMRKVEEEEGQ